MNIYILILPTICDDCLTPQLVVVRGGEVWQLPFRLRTYSFALEIRSAHKIPIGTLMAILNCIICLQTLICVLPQVYIRQIFPILHCLATHAAANLLSPRVGFMCSRYHYLLLHSTKSTCIQRGTHICTEAHTGRWMRFRHSTPGH